MVSGFVRSAVVGLFPTHTFVNVIELATSDNRIASTKPEFDTFTEYA